MRKEIVIFVVFLLLLSALVSCNTQPDSDDSESVVTRISEVPVTVEVTRLVEVEEEVEVTRLVKVTRRVQVTRIVEAPSIPTQTPDSDSVDTSQRFAHNFLGTANDNSVTVELSRVLFMQKNALSSEIDFEDNDAIAPHEYVGEILVRITNDRAEPVAWSYQDWFVRLNERQISLYDFFFEGGFRHDVTRPIFPGSMVVAGVWFGIGSFEPDSIQSAALLIRPASNPDTFQDVTGSFEISADLSGEHRWEEFPEELDF